MLIRLGFIVPFPKIQKLFPILLCLILIVTQVQVHGESLNDGGKINTLQLVHVVMRHGQRNPIGFYPLDPYKDEKYWKEGWGSLTETGLSQTFELGQFLRGRYGTFIDRTYKESEFSIVCSESTRTIRSGLSALRGLFPSTGTTGNCSMQQAQVVPIKIIPAQSDNYLMMSYDCPKFKKQAKKFMKDAKQNQEYEKEWLSKINKWTGLKATGLNDTIITLDNIDVQTHLNLNRTLPDWATPETVNFIQTYILYWLKMEVGNPQLKKFRSEIIQKLIGNMKLKTERKLKQKMIIFSAHDRTLTAILQILNLDLYSRPPYASALLIELHKTASRKSGDDDEYHVEIYYRNKTEEAPFKMEIQNCKSPCLLPRLHELLTPLFFKDYKEECDIPNPNLSKCPSSSSASTFLINIFFLFSSSLILID